MCCTGRGGDGSLLKLDLFRLAKLVECGGLEGIAVSRWLLLLVGVFHLSIWRWFVVLSISTRRLDRHWGLLRRRRFGLRRLEFLLSEERLGDASYEAFDGLEECDLRHLALVLADAKIESRGDG